MCFLSLPDELLANVVRLVCGTGITDRLSEGVLRDETLAHFLDRTGRRELFALRLVCRRLRDISYPMLCPKTLSVPDHDSYVFFFFFLVFGFWVGC